MIVIMVFQLLFRYYFCLLCISLLFLYIHIIIIFFLFYYKYLPFMHSIFIIIPSFSILFSLFRYHIS